jgi:hypothetical protein
MNVFVMYLTAIIGQQIATFCQHKICFFNQLKNSVPCGRNLSLYLNLIWYSQLFNFQTFTKHIIYHPRQPSSTFLLPHSIPLDWCGISHDTAAFDYIHYTLSTALTTICYKVSQLNLSLSEQFTRLMCHLRVQKSPPICKFVCHWLNEFMASF